MIDIVKLKLDLKMSNSMIVAGCHVLSRETYNEVHEALTELERLQRFKQTFDEYELAQKQGFIAYETWQECEKELETMKAKVKRYMELKPDVTGFHRTDNFEDKWKEFHDLESELKEW